MPLTGKNILITGASMGIGAAIAHRLAKESANLILLSRSEDKLSALAKDLSCAGSGKTAYYTADTSKYEEINSAVQKAVFEFGQIDILINNAGLAIGAPNAFPDLKIEDIVTMTGTNINGYITTGLEVPPFPGEAVYHSCKAAQEAFTNVLRTELQGTNIKVLALRPGVVATNFHELRVGYDRGLYDDFMEGMEPLVAGDVADAAAFMLSSEERASVTAVNVTPTAQRSLQVFDRTWNERNGKKE